MRFNLSSQKSIGLIGLLFAIFPLTACQEIPLSAFRGPAITKDTSFTPLPALPIAHTNNAVAIANGKFGPALYSFLGLRAGKTFTDTSKMAFACPLDPTSAKPAASHCRRLADVPVPEGRLASVAVTINNNIYLFGGYSVDEKGNEVSTAETLRFNPIKEQWTYMLAMPTPVDDTVAFTYKNRYIYLVSGWHNDGNVSLVQVFDTQGNIWFRATDYPGTPVFGHAGGAANGKIMVTDGVAVIGVKDGKRQYGLIDESWFGIIDPEDPAIITWEKHPPHPAAPHYRMAAIGKTQRGKTGQNLIIFAGGSDNAYNYNGIGYNGEPSKPSDKIFAFDTDQKKWLSLGRLPTASMDHRSLLKQGDDFFIIGGMRENQSVSTDITHFQISK